VIRLVVDLLPAGRRVARMPEGDALRTRLADAELPCLTFDDRSAAIERAYATLGHVDSAGDKIMTGGAHFA